MSEYSDLPDNVKKAIEELLETLSGMTVEDIFELLGDMLGEEGITDLETIIDTNNDPYIDIDEFGINLEQLIDEFGEFGALGFDEIEPYYEISHQGSDTDYGEIIVEMPGLANESYIDYYFFDNELFIHTTDAVENYKLIIPIPEYYHLIDEMIVYRNGLLIIPFEIY